MTKKLFVIALQGDTIKHAAFASDQGVASEMAGRRLAAGGCDRVVIATPFAWIGAPKDDQ